MAIWHVWQYMNSLFHFYFVIIDTHLYFLHHVHAHDMRTGSRSSGSNRMFVNVD